jgi:3-oxoacyl-[acyl-carrier-protein] synthase-3
VVVRYFDAIFALREILLTSIMPDLNFKGVGIAGMAAAVPSARVDNLHAGTPFTPEYVEAVVKKTGIRYRHIAAAGTCASDLCHAAAEQLIEAMGIERDSIDVLLFVSQTPDYRMPATGIILQDRLGLNKRTMAFDVNLGCSGFVYGLALAYSLLSGGLMRRVLLLNGETRSRAYSPQDRATGLLFGDAGSAVVVERGDCFGDSFFSLYSDGSRFEHIMIPSGGYRSPSSADSLKPRLHEDGSVRHAEHGVIKGASVFEFLLLEVSESIKKIFELAKITTADMDYFIFHQANRFMNEHLRRRLRIPAEKMPYSLYDFGNTSAVSIPLTMVTALGEKLCHGEQKLLLSGFGVGLSWGNAVLNVSNLCILPLFQLDGPIEGNAKMDQADNEKR